MANFPSLTALPATSFHAFSPAHQLTNLREAAPASTTPASPGPARALAEPQGGLEVARRWGEHPAAQGLVMQRPSTIGALVPLLRDPRQLRQFYRMARLKRIHSAFPDGQWGEAAEPRARELLTTALQGGDVSTLVHFQHKEPFMRYTFLLESERLAQRSGKKNPEVLGRLRSAQAALWNAHAADIASGFNTAPALTAILPTLQGWDDARAIYRERAMHDLGLGALYRQLNEAFGVGQLRAGLSSMRGAIRADLASPWVLADTRRRVTQSVDLERIALLTRVIGSVDDFLGASGAHAHASRGGAFLSDVIECTSGQVSERRLLSMHTAAFPDRPFSPASRALVVNFLLRQLPVTMWEQQSTRDALHHDPVTLRVD